MGLFYVFFVFFFVILGFLSYFWKYLVLFYGYGRGVSCGVVELGFVVEFLFFGGCGDVFKFLRERFGDINKFKFFLVVW